MPKRIQGSHRPGTGGRLRGELARRRKQRAILVGRNLGAGVIVGDEFQRADREHESTTLAGRSIRPQVAAAGHDEEIDEPGRDHRADPIAKPAVATAAFPARS
ncbi:MAG: hypothetical protein CRU72_09930 [Candidatus Accumulibacter phosphatis]|nr:hypothetical protein [Candidatus Accumulibacter phosphatis]